MRHRTSIPDLLIARQRYHGLGVVHVDRDFERIAEVRSLRALTGPKGTQARRRWPDADVSSSQATSEVPMDKVDADT
jgi:hypothetical protein